MKRNAGLISGGSRSGSQTAEGAGRPTMPAGEAEVNQTPGAEIRRLREERGLRAVDIDRISETIKLRKKCTDFGISHATLNDIENEHSVPNVRKMFSLAASLEVPMEAVLALYGVAPSEVKEYYDHPYSGKTGIEVLNPSFTVPFDIPFDFRRTGPIATDVSHSPALPEAIRGRVDPSRFSYAWVGIKDTGMGDLVPAGSLIEVDRSQSGIKVSRWSTIRDRPIYFCWTKDGHRCSWGEEVPGELILVPHPASQVPIKCYRTPRDAKVIGRVTYAWVPFARADVAPPPRG
jgi:transcriptional regulator with XRE-family HTH domain